MRRAVVVGAGINGLAVARGLVGRGWQVAVLDRGPIPNPEGASHDHHRLIRPHYADAPVYCQRIGEALTAWERLFADIGERAYVPRGVVALSRADEDWTERARRAFVAAGVAHEVVPAEEVERRFPHLDPAGVRYALLTRAGGALLAARILAGLARRLGAAGADLRPETPVTRVDPVRGRVETPAGAFEGDIVLLAAGVGLPALCPAPVPAFRPMRAIMVYADPPDELAAAWAEAPAWVDLGGEEGLWGIPPLAGLPLKLGASGDTQVADPVQDRVAGPADTAAVLGAYAGRVRCIERFRPVRTVANFYLMAPDERFFLRQDGRCVSLSADSGHGFKFGALTGEEVAAAIDADRVAALAPRLAGHAA
jgi:glycine/D-amino acid oxidase-like deaminating enzyme